MEGPAARSAIALVIDNIHGLRSRRLVLPEDFHIDTGLLALKIRADDTRLAADASPAGTAEPTQKRFRFNETVLVGQTFSSDEYERAADGAIQMTPTLAYLIRKELNELKAQMEVHEDSRHLTHFYKQ